MIGAPPAGGPAGEPEKPVPDVADIRSKFRAFQKQQRLQRLAKGIGKPRTQAEVEVWSKGVCERFGIPDSTEQDEPGGEPVTASTGRAGSTNLRELLLLASPGTA